MYGLCDSLLVPQCHWVCLLLLLLLELGQAFAVEGSQGSITHEQRFRTVSEP